MSAWGSFRDLFGYRQTAFEAAQRSTPETVRMNSVIQSPDTELLPEREILLARQREAIRNNGIASGAMQTQVDSLVGAGLRLLPRPDWRALGQTPEWANEWQKIVKSEWQQFAYDIDCRIDYHQRHNFDGLLYQAARSYLFNAEITATMEWEDDTPSPWKMSVNIVHPDLLSTPDAMSDNWSLRQGVQLGAKREPTGYWFRQAHRSEESNFDAPQQMWRFIPAYVTVNGNTWGRRQVIHVYDQENPDQTRGKPSFASALLELQSLKKFHRKALEQQIIQAMYAAVITSNASPEVVAGAMGRGDSTPLENYTAFQQGYLKETGGIVLDKTRIPHLMMGEDLKFMTPGNVAPNLEMFEKWTLHHLAASLNMSYEALSKDYTNTSYSSARASGQREWKFITGRRAHIIDPFATAVYAGWLEEAIARGRVPSPPGAPSFYEAKTAWCKCKWIGAARGSIDEMKEMQALQLRRSLGSLTFEELCAFDNNDSDEIIERLALEQKTLKDAGITIFMPGQSASGNAPAPDNGANVPSRTAASQEARP